MNKLSSFFIVFAFLLIGCSEKESIQEEEVILSTEKEFLKFEIPGYTVVVDNNEILITVPASQSEFEFKPDYELSEKATITPQPNLVDYKNPVEFTIEAEDGSTKKYISKIVYAKGLKSVKIKMSREINGYTQTKESEGIINLDEKQITFFLERSFFDHTYTTNFLELDFEGTVVSIPSEVDKIDINFDNLILSGEANDEFKISIINTENHFYTSLYTYGNNLQGEFNRLSNCNLDLYPGFKEGDYVSFMLETDDLSNITLDPSTMFVPVNSTVNIPVDIPLNLTEPKVISVTSESGETKTIKIGFTKRKIYFNIEFFCQTDGLRADDTGKSLYFRSVSPIQKMWLKDVDSGEIVECEITNPVFPNNNDSVPSGFSSIGLIFGDQLVSRATYQLNVQLEDGYETAVDVFLSQTK